MLIVVRGVWVIDDGALRCEPPQVLLPPWPGCPVVLVEKDGAGYRAAATVIWTTGRGRVAVTRHASAYTSAV